METPYQIPLEPEELNFVLPLSLISSVCKWNAARYAQEYNHDLTMDLLYEEIQETEAAIAVNDYVSVLDGLADVAYVAIGAMWKAGLTDTEIFRLLQSVKGKTTYILRAPELVLLHGNQPTLAYLAMIVLSVTHLSAIFLNGSAEAAIKCFDAVCTSNNTKLAVKTDSSVKANLDKGSTFMPPTAALTLIFHNIHD